MKHREPGLTTAGRVGRGIVYTVCGLVVLIPVGVGAAAVVDGPDPGPSVISTSAPSVGRSPEPKQETKKAPAATPTRPVRLAHNVPEVLARTRFVPEYKAEEAPIASGHTDQNLALHGVDICARIASDDNSLWDMIDVFVKRYHPHSGPVTAKAALRTFQLAVRDICPDLQSRYDAKRDLAADAGR